MNIILYKNLDDADHVHKNIVRVIDIEGELISPFAITEPVIRIRRKIPIDYNYVYIPEFERYYFLSNVSLESEDIQVMYLHIDVLMSHIDKIQNLDCILGRSETKYNTNLFDDSMLAYEDIDRQVIAFPNKNNFRVKGEDKRQFMVYASGAGSVAGEQLPREYAVLINGYESVIEAKTFYPPQPESEKTEE